MRTYGYGDEELNGISYRSLASLATKKNIKKLLTDKKVHIYYNNYDIFINFEHDSGKHIPYK